MNPKLILEDYFAEYDIDVTECDVMAQSENACKMELQIAIDRPRSEAQVTMIVMKALDKLNRENAKTGYTFKIASKAAKLSPNSQDFVVGIEATEYDGRPAFQKDADPAPLRDAKADGVSVWQVKDKESGEWYGFDAEVYSDLSGEKIEYEDDLFIKEEDDGSVTIVSGDDAELEKAYDAYMEKHPEEDIPFEKWVYTKAGLKDITFDELIELVACDHVLDYDNDPIDLEDLRPRDLDGNLSKFVGMSEFAYKEGKPHGKHKELIVKDAKSMHDKTGDGKVEVAQLRLRTNVNEPIWASYTVDVASDLSGKVIRKESDLWIKHGPGLITIAHSDDLGELYAEYAAKAQAKARDLGKSPIGANMKYEEWLKSTGFVNITFNQLIHLVKCDDVVQYEDDEKVEDLVYFNDITPRDLVGNLDEFDFTPAYMLKSQGKPHGKQVLHDAVVTDDNEPVRTFVKNAGKANEQIIEEDELLELYFDFLRKNPKVRDMTLEDWLGWAEFELLEEKHV